MDEMGMMGIDWSMFDPQELLLAMNTMSMEDKRIVGPQLDAMGLTRDVVEDAVKTGQPLPPPVQVGMNDMGVPQTMPQPPARLSDVSVVPTPQRAPGPPQYYGGMGEQQAPDMTSQAPSFVPPVSLGGLTMPTQAPAMPGQQPQVTPLQRADRMAPAVPGQPDPRTQAQRQLAAQQGVKMPQEQKPMHQDLRQAPAAPKQGDIKVAANTIQMLLAAALGGRKAGGGLTVPPLGRLVTGA